jgi:hypothetical protein
MLRNAFVTIWPLATSMQSSTKLPKATIIRLYTTCNTKKMDSCPAEPELLELQYAQQKKELEPVFEAY